MSNLSRGASLRSPAMRFVLLVGVMSLFADMTYEGSRSIVGPYLALLAQVPQRSVSLRAAVNCSATD